MVYVFGPLFLLGLLVSPLLLVIGLINPKWVTPGQEKTRTKSKLIYFSSTAIHALKLIAL